MEHTHIEFWTQNGKTIIKEPYQYMSPQVQNEFFALAIDMSRYDSRINFVARSDGQWSTIFNQPDLLYGKRNPNLNEGQPNYTNPWK